jgi:hypothetical protein
MTTLFVKAFGDTPAKRRRALGPERGRYANL